MGAKKGEAMTPERIDELARECAKTIFDAERDHTDPRNLNEYTQFTIKALHAKAIAQALRTVAREVMDNVAAYCQDDADKTREYADRNTNSTTVRGYAKAHYTMQRAAREFRTEAAYHKDPTDD